MYNNSFSQSTTIRQLCEHYLNKYPDSNYSELARIIIDEHPNLVVAHRRMRYFLSCTLCDKDEPALSNYAFTSARVQSAQKEGVMTYQSEGPSMLSVQEVMDALQVDSNKFFIQQFWPRVVTKRVTLESLDGEGQPEVVDQITGWRYSLHIVNKLSLRDQREMEKSQSYDWEGLAEELTKGVPVSNRAITDRQQGKLIFPLADMHTGAKTVSRKSHPAFNIDVLRNVLAKAVDAVHKTRGERQVILVLPGDLCEAFSGLNHLNSWQELQPGMWGANVVSAVHKILCEVIEALGDSLVEILLTPGNHDRAAKSAKDWDTEGQVAKLLHYMLGLSHPNIPVQYDPVIVSYYDSATNINYMFNHGHNGISKRPPADMILQYGKPDAYNVFAQGHLHQYDRRDWYQVQGTKLSLRNYTTITLPSIFPGNMYSDRNGWGCGSGICLMYESPYLQGVPQVNHIPLL